MNKVNTVVNSEGGTELGRSLKIIIRNITRKQERGKKISDVAPLSSDFCCLVRLLHELVHPIRTISDFPKTKVGLVRYSFLLRRRSGASASPRPLSPVLTLPFSPIS